MKLKSLIIAALMLAGTYASRAQSIATTASITPSAVGNTVCVTRNKSGSVYARGYTDNFASVVEFNALGGLTFEWFVIGHHLYIKPNGSPYAPTEFYLCGFNGGTLQVIATYNVQVGAQGLDNILPGASYLGASSGLITFNPSDWGQVQFKFVKF